MVDQETYLRMSKKAHEIFEYDLALDPDECHTENIDFDALCSLVNQISVRAFKQAARKKDSRLTQAIFARLKQEAGLSSAGVSNSCFDIAQRFRVNGYRMAKMMVEAKYGNGKNGGGGSGNGSSLTVPQILTESPNVLEEDQELLGEILQCMSFDRYNGHPYELMKESVGRLYEEYLTDCLTQHKMCFETEAELRLQGKPKTPDVLFLIPMAVRRDSVNKDNNLNTNTNTNSKELPGLHISDDVGVDTDVGRDIDPGLMSPGPSRGGGGGMTYPEFDSPIGASPIRGCSNGFDDLSLINSAPSTPRNGQGNSGNTYSNAKGDNNQFSSHNHHYHNHMSVNIGNHPATYSYQSDYAIVNWIDSKALFADHDTFAEHFEQLKGYVNRYGRGLVIYWHGYLDSIKDTDMFASANGMITLADTFPKHWLSPIQEHEGNYGSSNNNLNHKRDNV